MQGGGGGTCFGSRQHGGEAGASGGTDRIGAGRHVTQGTRQACHSSDVAAVGAGSCTEGRGSHMSRVGHVVEGGTAGHRCCSCVRGSAGQRCERQGRCPGGNSRGQHVGRGGYRGSIGGIACIGHLLHGSRDRHLNQHRGQTCLPCLESRKRAACCICWCAGTHNGSGSLDRLHQPPCGLNTRGGIHRGSWQRHGVPHEQGELVIGLHKGLGGSDDALVVDSGTIISGCYKLVRSVLAHEQCLHPRILERRSSLQRCFVGGFTAASIGPRPDRAEHYS